MTATFCGHSQVTDEETVKGWLRITIEYLINKGFSKFYLGGYGSFDLIAASVVCELKKTYPGIESILVLPYPDKKVDSSNYDCTIYPPLENTPKRYCIIKRNQWMVDNSDIVVSYITHDWGGASKTYDYAKKKGKEILNYAL